jgi:nucleotide-binding universal stress UspA family protein
MAQALMAKVTATRARCPMIRDILIGLDGSPYSQAAVELGIRWARRTQATLVGLGIVDEPSILQPEPTGIGGSHYKQLRDEALLGDARKRVDEFLEQFSQRCAEAGVPCRVLKDVGDPSQRIAFVAEDLDLTLLGQQTYFHFATQSSPDRTLIQVLHEAHRPVVAVPEKLPEGRPVVVAYDGTPPAVRALQAFRASGLDEGQPVYVVSVAGDAATAARHAEEGANFLRFYQLAAEALPLIASKEVAELLLHEVTELGAGMLVMGAFGRAKYREFLFGSTTHTILTESKDVVLFLQH